MEPTTLDPVSAPVDFPPPPPPPSIPTRSVGKKIFFILIIVILLALIGGGVFAYSIVFEVSRSAITASLATITNAHTFHQDVAIKAALESPVMFTAEGTIATDVVRSPIAGDPSQVAVVVDSKSGGFSVNVEARFIDNILYGKINEFPFLSFISSSATDSPIGKWYSVSLSEVEHYATEQGAPPDSVAKVKEQLSKLNVSDFISQIDALMQAGVLIPASRASLLRVDGVWARQYTVTINKEKLADFITAKGKELSANLPEAEAVDPKVVADSLKSVTFDPVIMTIGLFDHSLKKIAGGVRFSNSDDSTGSMAGSGAVSFVITYRDINGPITVAKPDNVTSLMEYVKQSIQAAKNNSTSTQPVSPTR